MPSPQTSGSSRPPGQFSPPADPAACSSQTSTQPPPSYPASELPPAFPNDPDLNAPDLKTRNDPEFVRQTLGNNGMWIEGKRLQNNYKEFHARISALLNTDRRSPKKKKEAVATQLVKWLEQNRSLPESALMTHFIPKLIPWERMPIHQFPPPPIEPSIGPSDEQESEAYIVKDFSDDNLMSLGNQIFADDFLPCWHQQEKIKITRSMMKMSGMTRPKPDFVFGIWQDPRPKYGDEKCSLPTRAFIGLAYYMIHPFFLIEGKRAGGDLMAAENQACRGGAALVNGRRLLNKRSGRQDELGADESSFVFSMTMDYYQARIWLHWCEIRPKSEDAPDYVSTTSNSEEWCEYFHMDNLQTFFLERVEETADLIAKLNNILDWGCLQRMGEIKKVFHDVWVKEQQSAASKALEIGKSPGGKRKRAGVAGSSSSSAV